MSFSTEDFAKALEQHDYQFQKGQIVRGKVASHASDGVYIDIGGKSAAYLPTEEAALRRVNDLEDLLPLNEERDFLIIREQDADGQVTLSLRQLELKRLWSRLVDAQGNNETVQVRVNGSNKGGVTVDVQGLRGFIPRSHLIDRGDLEALMGQSMTVGFLEVNPAQKKLVLSQRMATQAASLGQLEVGQLIDGKITGIKPFGVFIDFEGTTGLLHINQVSKNYVASIDSVFKVGQPIKAIVMDVDEAKGRVSLSTKVLENYPGEILENMAEMMDNAPERAEKVQRSIAKRGVEDMA